MADILDVNKNPPEGVNVLPNGAWQDKETGKIVRAAPDQIWDSKKASEMAKKRWAKAQEQTREGIQKAVQKHRPKEVIESFPQAHGLVVETLMDDVVLNEEERGKARVDAYKVLLEIEGSASSHRGAFSDDDERPGVVIEFAPNVAKYMLDRLTSRSSRRDPEPHADVTIELDDV